MNARLLSHLLVVSLLITAFPVILQIGSEDSSAAPDTHVWDGGGANALASTKENWVGDAAAPEALDSVVFDAGALPCTWDLAITTGTFIMDTGYSGVVTQTVAFGTSDLTIIAGTLTAANDPAKPITISGNLTKAGTLTTNKAYLVMTGDGCSLSFTGSGLNVNSLQISANITLTGTTFPTFNDFILDSGKTLTLGVGTVFTIYNTGPHTAVIDGTITGSGDLYFRNYGLTQTLTNHLGTITCNQVVFRDNSGSSGTISLASNLILGCALNLNDGSTSAGVLDTSTSNYGISCTDLTIQQYSTLRARGSVITVAGNWDSSVGTFNPNSSTLIMNGVGTTIKTANTNGAPYDLQISGTVSTLSSLNVSHNLTVDSTKTLTVSAGNTLTFNGSSEGTYSNQGTIAGTGTTVYSYNTADSTISPGTVNTPVQIKASSTAEASRTATIGGTTSLGSTLSVSSDSPSYSMTLDCGGYSVSATNISLGSGGVIANGPEHLICSENWDSFNGTMNYGTSTLYMIGNSKYVKTNTSGQVNNLVVNGTDTRLISYSGRLAGNLTISSGASVSLQNDSYLMNSAVLTGTLSQNSKRLNITGSSSTPLTGYGTFDGELALNGSTASSYQVQTGLPMGYLHTDRDTKISVSASRYLRVVPSTTEFVNASIRSYGTESGYDARWTADSTQPVTYSIVLAPSTRYDVWVDHTRRVGSFVTDGSGILQFTYNGPFSAHEFEVMSPANPPVSMEASFKYTIEGNVLTCTDQSYGPITMWLWSFGDGTGSTSRNPTHQYSQSGTYEISLTVFDKDGRSSKATTTITLKLGPEFPIERDKTGWNIYVSEKMTVSIPALALGIVGAFLIASNVWLSSLPLGPPKLRKIVGALLLIFAFYFFLIQNGSWW